MSTLVDLVPHAASIAPKSGLVSRSGELVSWAEVEHQVVRLAGLLVECGVEPGDRVVVLHPKSVQSFIAVHAVLRAGAIMVPLDPLDSVDAHGRILDATGPRGIISTSAGITRLELSQRVTTSVVVTTDEPTPAVTAGLRSTRVARFDPSAAPTVYLPEVKPDDAAYIIFTSGSTGTPKGIVHSHRSALSYATAAISRHELDRSARLGGTCPLHFDMSTLELYAVPLSGASAVTIGEPEQRFPATLANRIVERKVTHLYAVPFQLNQLVERADLAGRDTASLRQIAYGGEVYAPAGLAALIEAVPSAKLLNVYGPAEVNAVTSERFAEAPSGDGPLSIGRPWPGVRTQVLDDAGDEVPRGVAGELVVSAPTCMVGYWSPEGPDPAVLEVDAAGRRWYRTGDIVHTDETGRIFFHGRVDHQVKVRGVRIELEAVDAVMTDHPGVEVAVAGRVVVDGIDRLDALVVESDAGLDLDDLRAWCSRRLPSAAIPHRVVIEQRVPTTATGKVDRRVVRQRLQADHDEHE